RSARRTGSTSGRQSCHLPPISGGDERVDILRRAGEDDRPVGAGLAPALPRLARRATPRALRDVGVTEPVAVLEPDVHPLVLATPARGRERLEVERQVLLEVVLERAPAVADPARESRAGRRLAADD